MSILDKAQEIANKVKEIEQKSLEQKNVAYAKMREELSVMKSLVIDELKKIDGQQGFKVEFLEKEDWTNVFAYLTKFVGERTCESKIAWFKAKVVSGTYDASDDCRNIEYTEPRIWMRIYPPYKAGHNNRINDSWDTQELLEYSNGGYELYLSSLNDAPKFFANFAGRLSLWMV
jgi:hypothetical protein